MEIHILYTGDYYFYQQRLLRSVFLEILKKYEIDSVMLTMISMWRLELITNEKRDSYTFGEYPKILVNDDVESLFDGLRIGRQPHPTADSYFLPKLTDDEKELVEEKDPKFFATFVRSKNPDVSEAEMKLSESDSKFVKGWCRRKTFIIKK